MQETLDQCFTKPGRLLAVGHMLLKPQTKRRRILDDFTTDTMRDDGDDERSGAVITGDTDL